MYPCDDGPMLDRFATRPTAPIAAAGLIAGYAVAAGTGNRPLGGIVLAGSGLICIAIWRARDSRRVTFTLTAVGLLAFAVSHVLALAIGAWPSVLVCAAATAGACHRLSDARRPGLAAVR
jgi:hypothetical protein